jgi:N-acetylglucosamine malate deacetylase 1
MIKLDILVFGAHPDDVELSASGTILKHVALGKKVGVIDLTQGQLGSRGSIDLRKEEATKASKILKLTVRENLSMEDGFFENDQNHQLKVVRMIRKYRPEIVLANAVEDRHPDHSKGSKLVSDACFLSGLVALKTNEEEGEQVAWRPKAVYHYIQDRYQKPDFIIDVSSYWEERMKSILAYSSQFYNGKNEGNQTPISSKEFLKFIEARAREFGRQINCEFGEGYTVERTLEMKELLY